MSASFEPLVNVLLLCNDISTNPGPAVNGLVCSSCCKGIRKTQPRMQCSVCQLYSILNGLVLATNFLDAVACACLLQANAVKNQPVLKPTFHFARIFTFLRVVKVVKVHKLFQDRAFSARGLVRVTSTQDSSQGRRTFSGGSVCCGFYNYPSNSLFTLTSS